MTDQIKPGDIEVLLRFREMMGRWPDAGPESPFELPSEQKEKEQQEEKNDHDKKP